MKRIGFLWEQIVSVDNCRAAIIDASDNKKNRKNVRRILCNLDAKAEELSELLKTLRFITPYREKEIVDGLSGKHRIIQIPSFWPDQCAHHAIMLVLKPIIQKSSYRWSCGNIPKRGLKGASIGVSRATIRNKKHSKYCFKFDIRKFYPSVDHDVLKGILRRKIKDKKALEIIDAVIDSHPVGLPIGNYTSPWLAELVLQDMDRLILNCDGVAQYVRYVDDGVVIGPKNRKLHIVVRKLFHYLKTIRLRLKENWQVFQIKSRYRKGRKIDFVGKCFAIGYTTVRKRVALVFMRQSRAIHKAQVKGFSISERDASGFISRSSCLKYTDTKGLKAKYYDTINISKLKDIIREASKRESARQQQRRGFGVL